MAAMDCFNVDQARHTFWQQAYTLLAGLVFACAVIWPAAVTAATWEQTAGPVGGVVNDMVLADGKVYASLYSGGIYQWDSDRWQQVGLNNGLPENRSADLVVDPTDPSRIYAAHMIACGAATADGGDSWTGWCDQLLTDIGLDNFSSDTLVLDPDDPSTIYLFGRGHDGSAMMLQSADQGASWERVADFTDNQAFTHAVFFNDTLYLGLRTGGLMRSADRGITWEGFTTGFSDNGVIRFAIDETDDTLYVIGGLYQFNVRQGGSIYRYAASQDQWVAVAGPDNATAIAVESGRLWIGTDDGSVWKENSQGELVEQNTDDQLPAYLAEFVFDGDAIYAGLGGYGIAASTDNGKHWSLKNTGVKSMALRDLAVHPTKGRQLYALTWDRLGLFVSRNGGDSYRVVEPDNYFLSMGVDPNDFRRAYLGGPNTFYRVVITKRRSTLTELTAPGPTDSDIQAIAIHPNQPDTLLVGVSKTVESTEGYGVYRSTDGGLSWKRSKGFPKNGVYSILFNPNKPSVVYAAAFGKGVYKSRNGGRSFAKLSDSRLQYTYRLAMHPKYPKILTAGSHLFFAGLSSADQTSGEYGGLFKTTDGGANWTELTASLRDYSDDGSVAEEDFEDWKYNFGHLPNFEWVLMNPKDTSTFIVGHHGENVAMTSDNGATWTKPTSGMIPGNVHNYAYCLGTSGSFNAIYACTCGRGLFKGTFNQSSKTLQWAGGDSVPDDTSEFTDASIPRSAAAAHSRILSEVDAHEHTPLAVPAK